MLSWLGVNAGLLGDKTASTTNTTICLWVLTHQANSQLSHWAFWTASGERELLLTDYSLLWIYPFMEVCFSFASAFSFLLPQGRLTMPVESKALQYQLGLLIRPILNLSSTRPSKHINRFAFFVFVQHFAVGIFFPPCRCTWRMYVHVSRKSGFFWFDRFKKILTENQSIQSLWSVGMVWHTHFLYNSR